MQGLDFRPPQRYWHIRIDGIFARALAVSLLLHGLLLFLLLPKLAKQPLAVNIQTLSVRLIPVPNQKPQPPSPTIPTPVQPEPAQRKPIAKKPPQLLTSRKANATFKLPLLPAEPALPDKIITERPSPVEPTPENDMLAFLNARRQQATPAESSERPTAAANAIQDRLVAEQKREEIIARNLQQEGTSGLFQIREIVGSSAQFSFRGWQQNGRNSRFEIITVHAEPNETIERAIVRRMITIIREHYSADFNWQSQRYGRIIVLSARQKDHRELEDFLVQEFFASAGR